MNNNARNIFFSILLSIGMMLLVSPFALYWFIHGDYNRYIWIISGPFPLSYFGGGPFQMAMGLLLFFGGAFLIALYLARNNLRRRILALILIAAMPMFISGGLILYNWRHWDAFFKSESTPLPLPNRPTIFSVDDTSTRLVDEFTNKIQNLVIQNIGQPIEGFDAFIYLEAFHGLTKADFNEVEAGEGEYIYSNGELTFTRKQTKYISSAEQAILEKGHETLLNNLRARLGSDLSINEIISRISLGQNSVSGVRGTILLGPACPIIKNPLEEECADKPVFGTFIVKNAMGNQEHARFSTDANGKFLVHLPPGEYSIESETPLGPGIQAHLVEIKLGEISEYKITFDAGI